MSTKTYDKKGKLVSESDTAVPKDGFGPRDEQGKRLRGAQPTETPAANPAARAEPGA